MKEKDIDLYNRLVEMLNYLGCNQNISKFAKAIGFNSQNISSIYKRKTIPKVNFVAKIATVFPEEVNYHWLLTGADDIVSKPVFYVDKTGREIDGLDKNLLGYKKEAITKQNAYLSLLKEKDKRIIELQEELKAVKIKMIELEEQQIIK